MIEKKFILRRWQFIYTGKKACFFIGIGKRFQGLGFIFSTSNPTTYNEYILVELKILWLNSYFTYDLPAKKRRKKILR